MLWDMGLGTGDMIFISLIPFPLSQREFIPTWSSVKPDIKAEILKSVKTLIFSPSAQFNNNGFLEIIPDIDFLY